MLFGSTSTHFCLKLKIDVVAWERQNRVELSLFPFSLSLSFSLCVSSIDIYKKPRCPTSYTTHVKIRSGS